MSALLSEGNDDYVSLINIKPGTRRALVKGVIVELLEDPPQSATNIRDHRYHYRLADTSASIELAIPHGTLQDLVSRNFNTLGVVAGNNYDHIDSIVFPSDNESRKQMDDSTGFIWKESEGVTMNFVHGELRNIGAEYAEDSEWSGWSDDEHEESLKWLLQPGDVISITVATVWSHGKMVIVPISGNKEIPLKIGRLATNFKVEPDLSKLYTSSRE
ncbi:hypothetical protein BgAZ_100890 [Babesia gibsoni]|uniref:Uncharacterized protein n=1 Tax=Babesia gibsoni TaxID=33632 RepID=A0AAD8PF46_BABGI|nr:hypothetical protein BgAZ_100890 [Babesia gibsoni]